MTIMCSNNSKVCNNKAFGNMFRMYTLGVWSGHMLQDKETLRLFQITSDINFLDEFLLLLLVLCFLVFDSFCVLCSWPAAV